MNYAIFITSHNNPSVCKTLDTLKGFQYSGKYYIVIDDADKCIDEYKDKYKDNLVIFNKREYMLKTDSGHDSEHIPTACVLYARNFIEDKARELNLDSFIMCDDDIINFKFRVPDDVTKQVPSIPVKCIDDILTSYLEYLVDYDIACLGFGTPNFYFGGYESFMSGDYITRRSVSNFFFRNMNKYIEWHMPMEDFNTAISYGKIGELFLSPGFVEVIVEPQYTQKGGSSKVDGMANYYANTSSFTRAYYSTMLEPSFCSPELWKNKFIPKMSKDNAFPKIISDKFKI